MNYKNLVDELKQQTGNEREVCTDIVDAYEKYCTEEIKRPFQKEVDEKMIDWVNESTGHDKDSVTDMLNTLIAIVRKEIKSKTAFMK
ncbi:hypothetical protein [Enterococcus sp. AZ196]|uniref:hypothetical protein n=1 Tax=Enterococcus sp. AZ196 TaxID=2774659 RepID=UPI003D2D6DA6